MRPHGAGTLVLLAFAACACGFLRARTAPASSAEEALLTRRIEGLKKLVARGAAGSPLVDLRQAMVVVHQDVVRNLLLAATPFEQTIRDRYRVRIDSAAAEFADGFALVRLAGRAEVVGASCGTSPEQRERYPNEWNSIQALFVDQSARAVSDAHALLMNVVRDRGYPEADLEQRQRDLSVPTRS